MSSDERKLCVVCAWRGTCALKYSMPGGVALHCVEFTRDITLREPEAERRKRNVLVLGPQEIGKTTLVKRILDRGHFKAGGYYTRPVKEGFFRTGFELVPLPEGSGVPILLASTKMHPGWNRLGSYTVDVGSIDDRMVPRLHEAILERDTELVVLDEVSRMECLSERFRQAVVDCITSDKSLLATVSTGAEDVEFLRTLTTRSDVSVIHLGYDNRETLVDRILFMLKGEATDNRR